MNLEQIVAGAIARMEIEAQGTYSLVFQDLTARAVCTEPEAVTMAAPYLLAEGFSYLVAQFREIGLEKLTGDEIAEMLNLWVAYCESAGFSAMLARLVREKERQ